MASPKNTNNTSKTFMPKTSPSRQHPILNFYRDNPKAILMLTRVHQLSSNPPTTTLTPRVATLFLTRTTSHSLHNWVKCSSFNFEQTIKYRLVNHSSLYRKAKLTNLFKRLPKLMLYWISTLSLCSVKTKPLIQLKCKWFSVIFYNKCKAYNSSKRRPKALSISSI